MTDRRRDIDWIRDIIVLSILFFHSLIIFFTRESAVMYVRSGVDIPFCIIMEAGMSRFCMPILFILAGFSTRIALERKEVKQYIRNRIEKLLIPFLLVSVLLNPIVSYIYGLTQGRTISYKNHFILFITSISKNFEGRTTGYSPMHTWFILFLFVYSIVCLPLFIQLKNNRNHEILDKTAEFFHKPLRLLLFAIPYVMIFRIDILDEMNPIGYLYLYLFGYLLSTNEKYRVAIIRDRWTYMILSAGLLIISICGQLRIGFVFTDISTKAVRIIMPLAIMGMSDYGCSQKDSKVLSYLNKANYPIYLYHMLVLTTVGYFVLKIKMSSTIQFLMINIISYGICFMIYEIYRRIKAIAKDSKR